MSDWHIFQAVASLGYKFATINMFLKAFRCVVHLEVALDVLLADDDGGRAVPVMDVFLRLFGIYFICILP